MAESIDEEHLIMKVKQYPMLYDQQNLHYNVKDKKEAAWKEIGAVLRFPANECRIKWQTLRGSFRRAHKLVTMCKTGQSAKKRKLWRWYDLMAFLVPYTDDGVIELSDEENSIYGNFNAGDEFSEVTEFNIETADCEEDSSDASKVSTNIPASLHIKTEPETNKIDAQATLLRYLDSKINEEVEKPKRIVEIDPLKAFFQCMYETVRLFPPQYQTKAKCAVFQAVAEIETQLHNLSTPFTQNCIPQLNSGNTSSSVSMQQYFQQIQQPHPTTSESTSFNHTKLDVFNMIDAKGVILENSINLNHSPVSPVKLEES